MGKEQLGVDITEVMEQVFHKVYNPLLVSQLSAEGVTDHQRGKIAGQIDLALWIADKLNPVKVEEAEGKADEDGLSGQKLED